MERGCLYMSFFRFRRRFRWRRLLIPLFTLALIAAAISYLKRSIPMDNMPTFNQISMDTVNQQQHAYAALKHDDREYDVIKKIVFICGEETTAIGKFKGKDIYAMLEDNQHLQLDWNEEGAAVLLDYIEDFLPNCKDNAYFGLDRNGNLSLFEGLPDQNKVLRTFFQIDIQFLESSLPKDAVNQLYKGIKVVDFSAYNSVLSTFADFAVNRYSE